MKKKASFLKDPLVWLSLCVLVLGVAFTALLDHRTKPAGIGGSFAGVPIGGTFELINQEGEIVTNQSYAGQYKLIYFGFTFCPAICPTELQKMSAALAGLPSNQAEKIQPIFITIDPERDTVDVMKDYVRLFDENLVGLTGSLDQIQDAADAFRVYFAKVEDPQYAEYTMDHSSYIYLMSPEDELLNIYKISDDVQSIRGDLEEKVL